MAFRCLKAIFAVPRTRLELTRSNLHYPLKVACLPIPPPGQIFKLPAVKKPGIKNLLSKECANIDIFPLIQIHREYFSLKISYSYVRGREPKFVGEEDLIYRTGRLIQTIFYICFVIMLSLTTVTMRCQLPTIILHSVIFHYALSLDSDPKSQGTYRQKGNRPR